MIVYESVVFCLIKSVSMTGRRMTRRHRRTGTVSTGTVSTLKYIGTVSTLKLIKKISEMKPTLIIYSTWLHLNAWGAFAPPIPVMYKLLKSSKIFRVRNGLLGGENTLKNQEKS